MDTGPAHWILHLQPFSDTILYWWQDYCLPYWNIKCNLCTAMHMHSNKQSVILLCSITVQFTYCFLSEAMCCTELAESDPLANSWIYTSSNASLTPYRLFVSCSRLSPSTRLCRTRHPPTAADYHDTPAVTGGLHPLLDIAPKNRRTKSEDIAIWIFFAYLAWSA